MPDRPDFDVTRAEILVVDAVGDLAQAVRAAAVPGGFRLRVVTDFAAAAPFAPDLVFIDASDAAGLATCRRLRDAIATTATPLILAGPLGNATDIARGRDAGASDFVRPPFEPALLLARLQLHLAAAGARDALRREQVARLRAEDDSRAAHHAKSDLLASMGHEIHTPRTAIPGMSHLALQSRLNPNQNHCVEKVERSAELLLGTLNEIFDFACIEAGTLELQRSPFEIDDVLGSVARVVGLKAEEKGLELLFELPRGLPTTLIGDGARLAQVLVNLAQAAVRSGEQGEVVIAIEVIECPSQGDCRRTSLRFSVRDTGAATGAESPPPAPDLGDVISRALVRLMGAELTLSPPPAPGHVVHFTLGFDLPADAPPGAITALSSNARLLVVDDNAGPASAPDGADLALARHAHRVRLRGARILLVEDDPIIQELALDLLTGAGMVVSVAESGGEALSRLSKQPFDGVLMDCQMPAMDGYETTRALRAMPQFSNLPVIALTANPLEGERERVIAAGMNGHLAKPLDVALMFETLARWVQPAVAPEPIEASASSAPPDDPLARLPGIDAGVGRSSTMNNDKLYRRLLGMFLDGQRDFATQFRAARSAGDETTAMRLAHNLRAVSASLGALKVQQSSGALERACAEKASDAVVEPLLVGVENDLAPVIAGLGELVR